MFFADSQARDNACEGAQTVAAPFAHTTWHFLIIFRRIIFCMLISDDLIRHNSHLMQCLGTSPSDGSHRIGWVLANHSHAGYWNAFSPSYLCLGPTQGGDIDPHLFTDPLDGSRYLVWKSDDNRLGLPVTHIWAVQVNISSAGVFLIGKPQILLDSTELWWAAIDYVPDGYLIEGPEIIFRDPYYYLFFAAAAYCSPTYSEGVARSKNVFGPYEKLHIPLLSTGIVGSMNGSKIIGPGHASFIQYPGADAKNDWMVVWHASFPGETCVRTAFASYLQWGLDDWPYVVTSPAVSVI